MNDRKLFVVQALAGVLTFRLKAVQQTAKTPSFNLLHIRHLRTPPSTRRIRGRLINGVAGALNAAIFCQINAMKPKLSREDTNYCADRSDSGGIIDS